MSDETFSSIVQDVPFFTLSNGVSVIIRSRRIISVIQLTQYLVHCKVINGNVEQFQLYGVSVLRPSKPR